MKGVQWPKGGGRKQNGQNSDRAGLISMRIFQKAGVARTERLRCNWCQMKLEREGPD